MECEGWSEEAMLKYIKYRKSLDSKSKSKKDKIISASADQASLPSSRDSNVSQASAVSAGISEARVAELISMQLGQFSSSFAVTMQASFDDIKTFIDNRFVQENQLEPNPSIPDSSPVPVDLGPRQAQTDPSVCNPCYSLWGWGPSTGAGAGGYGHLFLSHLSGGRWYCRPLLDAATLRSNSVFASFYFRDISYVFQGLRSLGPFVTVGSVVNPL